MSVKSKHSASKKDKNGKKEKKKNIEESGEDIESSEEELDLTKECHPIGYYINDRAEMINQMFSVIKGNKLKAMLPPILKDYDADQLKLQCLDQLLGMSEKRIMCILEGGTLESSSESEVLESDECDSDEKNGTMSGSTSDGSDESHENSRKNHKKRKSVSTSERKGGKVAKTTEENSAPEQGKTLLEILELEMRARAIRALLKQSGGEKETEQENDENKAEERNANGIKRTTGEVVDLTECEDDECPLSVNKDKSEQSEFDERVLTFEEKIEKLKVEKSNSTKENEKSKKLQAELELRNKIFKKKIYRTRQQRMENEEEDKTNEGETTEVVESLVKVKTEPVEPKEPEEIVVEDPEEGEISSSEDDFPVEIKQEVIEEETKIPEETPNSEPKIDEDSEQVTAIDSGTFISNCNSENMMETSNNDVLELEISHEEPLMNSAEDSHLLKDFDKKLEDDKYQKEQHVCTMDSQEMERNESDTCLEETSWRDRWLQKDGVQKLVKSSKIYAKVKKRIAEKSQKAKEEVLPPQDTSVPDIKTASKVEVIEGSIEEYERLSGKILDQGKENETCQNREAKS